MKNYYAVLEISTNASEEAIKSAYRVLSKKYTTVMSGSDDSNEKLQEIKEAYNVLSDSAKRKVYDAKLREESSPTRVIEKRAPPPAKPMRQSEKQRSNFGGFLSRTISALLSLCICGLIVYGIVWVCQNGFKFIHSFISEYQSSDVETGIEDTNDAQYDAVVSAKLQQARETTDDDERQELFVDALELEMVEYVFKVMIYRHYTGESAENKLFAKQQLAEIAATTDEMREYFSDDEVDMIAYVVTKECFDSFDELESEYEYLLGRDWNKWTLNVNKLWETLLEKSQSWREFE